MEVLIICLGIMERDTDLKNEVQLAQYSYLLSLSKFLLNLAVLIRPACKHCCSDSLSKDVRLCSLFTSRIVLKIYPY